MSRMRAHHARWNTCAWRRFVQRRSRGLIDLRAMLLDRQPEQDTKPNDTHTIECQSIDPCPFNDRDECSGDAQDADTNNNSTCVHCARIGPSHTTAKLKVVPRQKDPWATSGSGSLPSA